VLASRSASSLDGHARPCAQPLSCDLATPEELRGEALFFGKAKCGSCHAGFGFTDWQFHNIKVERFYEPRLINGMLATADGPVTLPRCAPWCRRGRGSAEPICSRVWSRCRGRMPHGARGEDALRVPLSNPPPRIQKGLPQAHGASARAVRELMHGR